ncbi:MAG: hypothetical protein P1P76_12025 [Anaerolineales bacterium]|nr:hypothetical protein [Anaerolineales bacterium]
MATTKTDFVQDLDEIIGAEGPLCVSFFTPTHEVGGEWQGDRIHLKNLIQEAQKQLNDLETPKAQIEQLLEPAQRFLLDDETWKQMREGLAIFSSTDRQFKYQVPFTVEPLVVIGRRFHIKPILPWLTRNGPYYLLALSQNNVRLFKCSPESCVNVDLGSTPTSIQEALHYDDPETRLTMHTTEKQGLKGAGDPAMFHGHGVGQDDQEANLKRYLHAVATGVENILGGEKAPLMLYGVEENIALYREVNSFPHLFEVALHGNPDVKEAGDLHREADKHMQDYFERGKTRALERFNNHRGTDQVSQDLEEVLIHAFQARIAYLFVAVDDHVWGQFDPDTLQMQQNDTADPGRVDLLDLCAAYTLQHGGEVFALPGDEMPVGDTPIAALLRF